MWDPSGKVKGRWIDNRTVATITQHISSNLDDLGQECVTEMMNELEVTHKPAQDQKRPGRTKSGHQQSERPLGQRSRTDST